MKNMKKVLFGLTILASLGAITLQAQPLWTDSMAYPVGLITTNSDGLWLNHSGNQDTFVQTYPGSAAALAGNRYEVNQTRTGDIHRWFVPANTNRYAAGSNTVLYASFTVSVTNLPAYPNGTYFAHFMDNGTFFRGRIFTVLPPNPYPFISAAPGMFRFGVACAQGDAAPGGEMSYVVDGKMTKGFAMIARPSVYGTSGIMTFIVAKDGKVYQKNLGEGTSDLVKAITEYNPDKSWEEVKE